MAALPSPSQSPEVLVRSAPASVPTVTPKLRESCCGCSVSKLKCSKEKPTCARCLKRGLKCEYFATRRAGRKRQQSSNEVPQSQSQEPQSSNSPGKCLPPPQPCNNSSHQQLSSFADNFPDPLSPPSDSTQSVGFSPEELDAFLNWPVPLADFDANNGEIFDQSNNFLEDINENSNDLFYSLLLSGDDFSVINANPPGSSNATHSSSQKALPTNIDAVCLVTQSQPEHCCLTHALSLLKELFPNASSSCSRSGQQEQGNTPSQLRTIQSVVAVNEHTIEAINNMLQCPCSQDAHLLTIIALIVSKVLSWYANAARRNALIDLDTSNNASKPQSRKHSLSQCEQVLLSPGSHHVDGEDEGRIAAQFVLSELCRVQQLVNQLSQRLKGDVVQAPPPDSVGDQVTSLFDVDCANSPFSDTMLGQLQTGLRKQLRALSLEIVGILRQE